MHKISKKQMAALDESIDHWHENVENFPADLDISSTSCALCYLKNLSTVGHDGCDSCIIHKDTGSHFCRDTPYSYIQDHIYNDALEVRDIEMMLDYLIDLKSRCEIIGAK